jgi:hypothetical protein
MMRNIQAHQATEPPTHSVLVPETHSSTSSLGNPSASNHIPTTPVKSPSIISALDPPEEITMEHTKSNHSTHKSKPLSTNPKESNSPDVPSAPTLSTQVTTTHGPQTIIVQTDKDPKPMNFPF